MISVIIPALNEETYLPLLLKDLKRQAIKPEIIVIDGSSKDRTVNIAKTYGCRVEVTSVQNASIQRNVGAIVAKGNILVFIDADMRIFDSHFLQHISDSLSQSHSIALAVPVHIIPKEQRFLDLFLIEPPNWILKFSPTIGSRGGCMVVTRKAFEAVEGFNPSLIVAEDKDLYFKLRKIGKIVCSKIPVYESPRRYRKNGRLKTLFAWTINTVWAALFGHSLTKNWR